jgi:DNA-binding response OmpR family regulator
MAAFLEAAGYKVNCYPEGIGALELILAEKPALVILDSELPGQSSLSIIRSLRSEENNQWTPVFLVGANMREEDILIGLEVGADFCLREALHPQVFLARVRSLVRRSEALQV